MCSSYLKISMPPTLPLVLFLPSAQVTKVLMISICTRDSCLKLTNFIPESSLHLLLLKESHGGGLMGHFGRDKTYAMLSTHYYWPRMKRDVDALCFDAQHVSKLSLRPTLMVFIFHYPFHMLHGPTLAWTLC